MRYITSYTSSNGQPYNGREIHDSLATALTAWQANIGAMAQAGIIVHGNGLQEPSTATQVRLRDGKRVIHDGPYADTKEHLGGYFIIEVAHLDDALEWAARSPNASSGSTEVRPVLPPPQQ